MIKPVKGMSQGEVPSGERTAGVGEKVIVTFQMFIKNPGLGKEPIPIPPKEGICWLLCLVCG